MKYEAATLLIAFFGLAAASPLPVNADTISRREVPQEHSHQKFLDSVDKNVKLDNPDNIANPVFGLLGNAAAAGGAGKITNLDCLHQATADRAFTNAKAASDVAGMTDALIYAALERNTGSVGLESAACNDKAVNPEVQAIKQHQDPAATGAKAGNKAIVLELAKQIASVGGNPQDALLSGTFAPGKIGDPTAKGNTCDTLDDAEGCIFTQNLLVDDATAAEIDAAVAGVAAAPAASANKATGKKAKATKATAAKNVKAAAAPASCAAAEAQPAAAAADDSANSAAAATGTNVQTFTGTLGGTPPPVVSSAGDRPFSVNGNTFVNAGAALQRSCAIQNNACANAVNSGSLKGKSVGDCNDQEKECNGGGAAKRAACAIDFGTCTDPSIEFTSDLPDRQGSGFIASNQQDFNHGSALNIGVIAGFICDRLSSTCKAGADAVSACAQGQAAATGKTGQAAADAFNSALGVSA